MHQTRLWIAAVLLLCATTIRAAEGARELLDDLGPWLERVLEERQIPGLAIAVVQDGHVLKVEGYGFADLEHQVPVTENTLFQTASVGKMFTAAGILALAEAGRLDLSDPITEYVEELPAHWRLITIEDLLRHTSGIPDYGAPPWDLRQDYTEGELMRRFAEFQLHFPPGEEWSYSNAGYAILGVILSRVSGVPWSDYLADRLFEPAGMSTARSISEADVIPNRASGYRLDGGVLKNEEWVSPSLNSTADGALYVSARDLAQWAVSLSNVAVLSDEARAMMWSPTRLRDGSLVEYGLGWGLQDVLGRPAAGHGGAWQGFNSHVNHFHEERLTIAVLANRSRIGIAALAEEIAIRLRPAWAEGRDVLPERIVLPREELEAYAGSYWMPDGVVLDVLVGEHELLLANPGPEDLVLVPYGNDSFYLESSPSLRHVFWRDASGAVEGFRDPSGMIRARKVR